MQVILSFIFDLLSSVSLCVCWMLVLFNPIVWWYRSYEGIEYFTDFEISLHAYLN